MSPSPAFRPAHKYGSVAEQPAEDQSRRPSRNKPGGGQQRRRPRWRGLAATTLGAAVIGYASYNRQTPASTPPSGGSGEYARLVDVATAPATAEEEAPSAPRPFPKVVLSSPKQPPAHAQLATAEIAPLAFSALNFYHVRDGKPGQDYPWLKDVKLIEPHRETTLSVSSPRNGFNYQWEVRGSREGSEDHELRVSATGAEVIVTLTALDEITVVTLREVDSSGDTIRQLDEVVMVKYVRREIRTLTDEEREELMDAMFTIWDVKVDGGNGKELYGNDYADIYAIQRLHFKGAMNSDCDHFHDGLGFMTTHSLMTNTFEYSLQLVNPKLTVPYWDFTIEEMLANKLSADDDIKIESPIFEPEWFGSADPVDHIVKDGRWAWTEIPTERDGNPGELVPDVYGMLRSAWVVNSSPYLQRGMGTLCDKYDVTQVYAWPSCEEHYAMVTDYEDFASWAWEIGFPPHGPIHTWIGGVLNCEDSTVRISALIGEENAENLALFAFDQRKGLWEAGYFKCDGRATMDMTMDDVFDAGLCGALDLDLTQGDDWKTIYYNSTIDFDGVISEYDDDTKRQVVALVMASTIYDGDHLHAGSAIDPSFWPIHPTIERLFMYGVMTGNMQDLTWPDVDDEDTNTIISRYGSTCDGHSGSDVFPFELLDDDDGFNVKTGIKGNPVLGNELSNREVLAAMDTSVERLPYIYDTFTWDHCLERGVDFGDAWNNLSAAKEAATTMATKKSRSEKEKQKEKENAPLKNGGPPGARGNTKAGSGEKGQI